MIERILSIAILLTCGIALSILGYQICKKEKIDLMHSYHINNISKENRRAFSRLSGIGLLIMGIGLIANSIVVAFTDSMLSFLCLAISFVIGIFLLCYAIKKYNH